MPLGPSPQYIVKYNNYQLPGYAQTESLAHQVNFTDHLAPHSRTPLSKWVGDPPKSIDVELKVWEPDYATAKEAVQQAATYLRSAGEDYAPLYIGYTNRHYNAKVDEVTMKGVAGTSVRVLSYTVKFRTLPWLEDDTVQWLSGTGLITTDSIGRTIADGGFSPVTLYLSGTNITVLAYTDTLASTGKLVITGGVSGAVIDSLNYTAVNGTGQNINGQMLDQVDYAIHVGPGKTYFNITGASSCSLSWHNRWYL